MSMSKFSRRPQMTGALSSGVVGSLLLIATAQAEPTASNGYQIQRSAAADGTSSVSILHDGNEVAVYRTLSVSKPVVWPLRSRSGIALTRSYPVGPPLDGEADDHVHHRSLWIGHGSVNGTDFWSEVAGHGTQRHIRFSELSADAQDATIATENDWLNPQGKRLLVDRRRYRFHDDPLGAAIDCDFSLLASDGPVVFGDTKEGTFALRVAGALDVDRGLGGRILNAEGQTDAQAWGQASPWVDYYGTVNGQPVGILVMVHPTIPIDDTRWHVRTYGLFAHNPFGRHEFEGVEQPGSGFRLAHGQTLALHYRVVLHEGHPTAEQLQQAFERYAAPPDHDLKPPPSAP
jgi:hypothetical protein